MNRPKAILFDFGNTLLHTRHMDYPGATVALFSRAHNPRGINLPAFVAVLDELRSDIDPRRNETLLEVPLEHFQRLLYERLGMSFDLSPGELAWEFWRLAEQFAPAPGVRETLAALTARGLPLGVVSNLMASGQILRRELAGHGLADFFTFLMASSDYGVRKPHPALFRTAAGKLNLDPKDIWFVGDAPIFDVQGSKAVGMTAIWYNWCEGPPGPVSADAEIRSLAELPALVDRFR